jgi:CRISPR-associated protein (TIGR02584 family)
VGSPKNRTKKDMKRNILLCVAGMTPQIITETLFALTQTQKAKIDEVQVITTLDGRDEVTETLLDK